MQAANKLMDAGLVPFVPHLTYFWDYAFPRPYEEWLEYDLRWLETCDIVLRLPGKSPGADAECRHANKKPYTLIYYNLEVLLQSIPFIREFVNAPEYRKPSVAARNGRSKAMETPKADPTKNNRPPRPRILSICTPPHGYRAIYCPVVGREAGADDIQLWPVACFALLDNNKISPVTIGRPGSGDICTEENHFRGVLLPDNDFQDALLHVRSLP